MKDDMLLYVGQKAFIEKHGDVLVLNDPTEGLDFPGGKIQDGETDFTESLRREVREETGLEIDVGEPFATWYNEFPISSHAIQAKKVYLIGFKCNYRSGEVMLSDEHNNFHWVNVKNYHEVDNGTAYFKVLDKYFKQKLLR